MVLPEGAPPQKTGRPASWKLGGLVAALSVTVVLMLLLVSTTSPVAESAQTTLGFTTTTETLQSPTTSSTTTTIDFANFTIGAIATGERLSWFRAPTFVSGWPIALVPYDNRIWLFTATTTRGLQWGGAGLTAWVSSDGVDWASAGVVASEEFSATGVEAVEDRLVAIGSRLSDGTPHVWVSGDGSNWTASALPVDLDTDSSLYRTWLTGVAGVGDSLHLSGFVEPDWQAQIVDRLPPEIAEHVIHDYGLGYSDMNGERRVEVYGPMGLIGYSASLSELGIDTETAARVFGESHTDTSFMWSSENGTDWSSARIEDMWVQELAALPDGTLFVNGGDYRGNGIWSSSEGSDWERIPSRTQLRLVGTWKGELLAISNDRDLVVSNDGDEWDSLGTDELLPWRLYWQLHPVATADAGLAVGASTWPENTSRQPASVTVNRDGSTLTFDPTRGDVTVSNGELEVSVPLWRGEVTDLTRMDFTTEEVAFLHPESGEVVGTFTFDDLHRAEATAFGPDAGIHALIYTETGDDWSIIDLAEGIGPESRVLLMEYYGDQLVMVTTNSNPWSPREPLRFSVRVASLP